jgi:hypothetical protein
VEKSLLEETAKAARQLARIYHCSPFVFLDLPSELVWQLYHDTLKDLAEEAGEEVLR